MLDPFLLHASIENEKDEGSAEGNQQQNHT